MNKTLKTKLFTSKIVFPAILVIATGVVSFSLLSPSPKNKPVAVLNPASTVSKASALGPSSLAPNIGVVLTEYNPPFLAGCITYPTGITSQSALTYDSTRNQILMYGGGHATVPRDDVDVFNTSALTWNSAYPSTATSEMTFANFNQTTGAWNTTGHPVSRHTYDMLPYAPNVGELVMVAAVNPQPNCLQEMASWYLYPGKIWHYNPTTKAWKPSAASITWQNDYPSSEYDPVSGKVIIVGRAGMFVYDPVAQTVVKVLTYARGAEIGIAQNLVYFPPNQKMYYVQNNGTVFEVTLDRNDFTKSTVTAVTGITGSIPTSPMPPTTDVGETGWAYDSTNKIIGGGVTNGVFYAYEPISKVWASKVIVTSPAGINVGSISRMHTIDYDPVHNMFVFLSRTPPVSGKSIFNTWGYRYGDGNALLASTSTSVPSPTAPPIQTPAADTVAPSVPSGLFGTSVSQTQINLSWSASTDNTAVTGYKVYKNGTLLGTTQSTTYQVTGLTAGTAYSFSVSAYDAVPNNSAQSSSVSVTTSVATPVATTSTPTPTSVTPTPPSTPTVISNGPIPGPGSMPVIPETVLHIFDGPHTSTTYLEVSNGPTVINWVHPGGDWSDKNGTLQGTVPYASAGITANNTEQVLTFDVTELVKMQSPTGTKSVPNRGWLVQFTGGKTIGTFYLREYADTTKRPKLKVTTTTGTYILSPGGDTVLSKSSLTSGSSVLTTSAISQGTPIAIWFDLRSLTGTVTDAKLILTSTAIQYSGGTGTLGVFPVDLTELFSPVPVQSGIAAKYKDDIGIEKDPSVIFMERFPDMKLHTRGWWWDASNPTIYPYASIVGDSDPTDPNYKPLASGIKAYRMSIPKGGWGGDFGRWLFWSNLGYEPEEIYVRAYVRLGTDYDSMQGKFPLGFDSTYHPLTYFRENNGPYLSTNPVSGRTWSWTGMPALAGNGGSTSDGTNGWSARGGYRADDCDGGFGCQPTNVDNPLAFGGYRQLNYYLYWADQPQPKGTTFDWNNHALGAIPKNQWVAVDEYLKINTLNADGSGNKDGVLRAWINGRLAYERTDYRFRNWPGNKAGAEKIKIYSIWLDHYHGGLPAAKSPMTVYMSNLVIAKNYIGPTNVNGEAVPYNPPTVTTPPTLSSFIPQITTPAPTTVGLNTTGNTSAVTPTTPVLPSVPPTQTPTPLPIPGVKTSQPSSGISGGTSGGGAGSYVSTCSLNQEIKLCPDGTKMIRDSVSCLWRTDLCLTKGATPSNSITISGSGSGSSAVAIAVNSLNQATKLVSRDLASSVPGCSKASGTIKRRLVLGSKGTDVLTLQCKLVNLQLLDKSYVTGYYGSLTKGAVKNLQCQSGILCTKTDPSYGEVGPGTRAFMAKFKL